VQGVEDLGVFHLLGQPNVNIRVDRERAAPYGLNSGDLNSVIQAAMAGKVATQVLEGDRQFPVQIRLAPKFRDSLDAIAGIPFVIGGGVVAL